MKLLFKIYCLLFITVSSVYGQEITIFDQSYETKPSTYILLDLKNIDFRVEQSIDDKVHILVHTTFHNYSKKNIEKYRKRMKIGLMSSNNKNYIGIVGSGSFFSTPSSYISKGKLNNLSSYKKDTIEAKKTKQKILEQIGFDDQTKTLSLFKIKPNVVKMKSAKKSRSFSENFVIKIPKSLLLKIKGENTNFAIKEINNPLEININRGGVYAKKLSNQSNKIYLKDAFLRVEEINGGDYKLNDVYKGLIGEMKNATITSNFSKLEIGEIQENTKITDFNGTLWL